MQIFFAAAALLAIERLAYIWISRYPDAFRRVAASLAKAAAADPITTVRGLFLGFKALQIGVFAWWFHAFGAGVLRPADASPAVLALGIGLIAVGQILNISVFRRLGTTGVFYGTRFGHDVPWRDGFPFSVFKHPQYVGTVLSIWGLFLVMRFPNVDWMLLPLLETAYYSVGARLER